MPVTAGGQQRFYHTNTSTGGDEVYVTVLIGAEARAVKSARWCNLKVEVSERGQI